MTKKFFDKTDNQMETMEENHGKLIEKGPDSKLPSFAFLPIDRDSETYNMMIFNHENFNPNLDLKSRSGSTRDRDNSLIMLRDLDFELSFFNDLTYSELTME